jgi:hypothetical protein
MRDNAHGETDRWHRARWILALAEAMPFGSLYMVGSWSPPAEPHQ